MEDNNTGLEGALGDLGLDLGAEAGPTNLEVEQEQEQGGLAGVMDEMGDLGLSDGNSELADELKELYPEKKEEEASIKEATPEGLLAEGLSPQEKPKEEKKSAEEAPVVAEEKEAVFIESPLVGGKQKVGGGKAKGEEEGLTVGQPTSEYIKSNFGIDKPETFFESAKKWRNDSQNYEIEKKRADDSADLIAKLPPELYAGVKNFYLGKDWKAEILSSPNIDFSKNVGDMSTQELVDTFNKGQISQEQWEEYRSGDLEEGDPTLKLINILKTNSVGKFNQKKEALDNMRANEQTQANERQAVFASEVSSSAKHLRNALPDVNDTYAQELESSILSGGLKAIFFNDDGSLKEDALMSMAMAKDGAKLIKQQRAILENQAETKANQGLLGRTPDKPQKPNGEALHTEEGGNKKVADYMSTLTGQSSEKEFRY